MAKKHSETKQFFIGAAITLAVWALGVFSAGRMPFIVDYVYVSSGNETLSLLYPFFFLAYSVIFFIVCKRKSKDAMFFGSYLFLLIPSASFLFLQICSCPGLEFLWDLIFVWIPFAALAVPALSAFDGFFDAVYGNTQPVGFSEAHIVFCILLVVVCVLPPIIYKLVKSKQPFPTKL